jgi:hypothetical protein
MWCLLKQSENEIQNLFKGNSGFQTHTHTHTHTYIYIIKWCKKNGREFVEIACAKKL